MKKDIKDYLHLYLGQEFLYSETKDETHYELDADRLCTIYADNDFKYIKLLLRPLSNITEKEIEEWNKTSTPIGEMSIESAQQIHWAKRLNYYRSIGIDCDGLIDSGIAIDKTILK